MSFLDVIADFTTTALITAISKDEMIIEWVQGENIDRAMKVKLPDGLKGKSREFHEALEGTPLSGASIDPLDEKTGLLPIQLHFTDLTLNLNLDPNVLTDRSLDSESSTQKFDDFLNSGQHIHGWDLPTVDTSDLS